MVNVAGAVFSEKGKVFICQRAPHKGSGLMWEFPGGKTEEGETNEEALIRECREELGAEIICGKKIISTVYEYPDITVNLTLYEARVKREDITLLEHVNSAWVTAEELAEYNLCPADRKILPDFIKWMKINL